MTDKRFCKKTIPTESDGAKCEKVCDINDMYKGITDDDTLLARLYNIQCGACDINAQDEWGNTIMILGSYFGDECTLKKVLDLNPDPNIEGVMGQTAINIAIKYGFMDIVKLIHNYCVTTGKTLNNIENSILYAQTHLPDAIDLLKTDEVVEITEADKESNNGKKFRPNTEFLNKYVKLFNIFAKEKQEDKSFVMFKNRISRGDLFIRKSGLKHLLSFPPYNAYFV